MPVADDDAQIVLDRWLTSRLSERWGALVGLVVSFDAGPPAVCTVQPAVWDVIPSSLDPDADTSEPLPVLPNVPILYPRGGSVVLSWPLRVGDGVLLIFSDLSPADWRRLGRAGAPTDKSRSDLSHAYAVPGIVPDVAQTAYPVVDGLAISAPALMAFSTSVRLGIDDTSDTHDKYVALADKVQSELGSLADAIRGAAAPSGGGALTGFSYTPGDVAATRVKAR